MAYSIMAAGGGHDADACYFYRHFTWPGSYQGAYAATGKIAPILSEEPPATS